MKFKVFCLILIFIIGCAAFTKYGRLYKSAVKNYQNSNYDKAFYDLVQSLKIKPDYKDALYLIEAYYSFANKFHKTQIENLRYSDDKFKWDNIVEHYKKLKKINETADMLPQLLYPETNRPIIFNIENYTRYINTAEINAAESHYNQGLELMEYSEKKFQKQAAQHFKIADRYVDNYKNSEQLYNQTRKAAIKRIAIFNFENKSGKPDYYYGAVNDRLTDYVISYLMKNKSAMEFLQIVSRQDLKKVLEEQQISLSGISNENTAVKTGEILGVNEILLGKITGIIYSEPYVTSKIYTNKKDVITGQEKYKDDEGEIKIRNVYETVSAKIKVYNVTAKSSITASYRIIDVETNQLKKIDTIVGEYIFKDDWAEYKGDKRAAFTYRFASLLIKEKKYVPSQEEMIDFAVKDLSVKLAESLVDYTK